MSTGRPDASGARPTTAHHGHAHAARRGASRELAPARGRARADPRLHGRSRSVAGILAHSLALLSDAAHTLTDAAALALSLVVIRLVRRPPGAT